MKGVQLTKMVQELELNNLTFHFQQDPMCYFQYHDSSVSGHDRSGC